MNTKPENQIAIVVDGGMVTEVYTNLPAGAELEILDFDCAKRESTDKFDTMAERLKKIRQEQKQLY